MKLRLRALRQEHPFVRRTAVFVVFLSMSVALCVAALSAANPVPLIDQPLVPDAAAPGGPGFTLTVNGAGFVSGATVEWNGNPRTTTFVDSIQLTATINPGDIATAGTASVTVVNPPPGGGTSNVVFFSVTFPTGAIALANAPGSPITVGSFPFSVAAGDFNGDGKVDVAVANRNSNSVSVLLGNGDGTFQPPVNYGAGLAPQSVAVGDFNGDGKLDLAVANYDSKLQAGSAGVLLGIGDGTFQPIVDSFVGFETQSIAVGDFNGDGKLDVALPTGVLLGNGDGTFQAPVNFVAGNSPNSLAVGDFNGDGKPDLAVGNWWSNNVSVLLGNGDGTFQAAVNYAAGTRPYSVAVGDFNGDGNPDLVVANQSDHNVSVLLGNGDGTFQPAVNYATGSGSQSVAVGDFNGDGKPDLVVAGGLVSVLLGNGDGTFQSAVNFGAGTNPWSVAVGDFNGDGRLDLAVANAADGTLSVLLQAPVASVSPSSLTFGDQDVGTTSPPGNRDAEQRGQCAPHDFEHWASFRRLW